MPLLVPVSWGELTDKITILQIKSERITDSMKLANVRKELEALEAVCAASGGLPDRTATVVAELRSVNAELWDIEDDIRECERAKDFGERFVALARKVYRTNDRRAGLKRIINDIMGSELIEEKSYKDYD
ncbi:DUF6165 family protein [Azospirillum sp. ST 5-10]|uniref:DUF6165 family protein n=1 Tax=unclassified Azospirillum TaxID=2630922 RepID=UPI003F49E2D1